MEMDCSKLMLGASRRDGWGTTGGGGPGPLGPPWLRAWCRRTTSNVVDFLRVPKAVNHVRKASVGTKNWRRNPESKLGRRLLHGAGFSSVCQGP